MKRIIFILLLIFAVFGSVFAQQSLYVRANGSDANDGFSETAPMKSLKEALVRASDQSIKTIIIIGTLNVKSEGLDQDAIKRQGGTFLFSRNNNTPQDITITGKPNASRAERAVLSGKGSGAVTVHIFGVKVNFENIEISGGEGALSSGILLSESANVTLGPGTVVRNNSAGLSVYNGICTIDGGEVMNNSDAGAFVADKGVLIMNDGAISNNGSAKTRGGGVIIGSGGVFTMSDGTINANKAEGLAGGVLVLAGGRFDQTGGTIRNNTAGRISNSNIFRQEGSLGTNL